MSTDIEARVKEVIAEQMALHILGVYNDSTFESLGADSLDQIEIVMAIEDEFGIQIDDDEAEKIQTVQQAIDYVARQQTSAPA